MVDGEKPVGPRSRRGAETRARLVDAAFRDQPADARAADDEILVADRIDLLGAEAVAGAERAQDKAFVGNIVEAIKAYGEGKLGTPAIKLSEVDRIIAIGSDAMMAAVGRARHGVLEPLLKPEHHAIGSINSPMQCMMKEICAQCLQVHRDPDSGVESVVFSCFNQDQDLDRVDFDNLRARLNQNGVQEKRAAQWIDRFLKGLRRRAAA